MRNPARLSAPIPSARQPQTGPLAFRKPLAGCVALVALLLVSWTGSAGADRFDSAAKGSKKVQGENALGGLFWSQKVNCGKVKGDFRQRQCRGVRDSRRAKVLAQTYLVEADATAVEIEQKASTISARVTLRACVACGPEGEIVVGRGAHQVKDGRILAVPLGTETKVFKKLAQMEHWTKYIGSRLRAQFVVKVTPATEQFKAAGRNGYKVSVVGYRLYDPCKGEVLVSKPSSKKAPIRSAACKDVPALEEDGPKKPVEPVIVHPDRLSTTQIKTAMLEVKAQAKKCHAAYGIDGAASFKIVIAGSGALTKAVQSGDFKGTPTGICLDKAIKLAVFPKSKKKATPITYPLSLR